MRGDLDSDSSVVVGYFGHGEILARDFVWAFLTFVDVHCTHR